MDPSALFLRYQELQRYVGWTDDDAKRVASLRSVVELSVAMLIDDFYDEISRHANARKVITGGTAQVERLKGTLRTWVSELFSGQYDEAYVARRWRVGCRHVEIGLDQVYTNVALSRLRSGLVRMAEHHWTGHRESLRLALRSLHNLLDLDLAIIEDAYQAEHHRRQDLNQQRLEELVKERTSQLRQADRLASIGTLAAGLGHDMHNVLLPIRARLDAVDAASLPSKTKEHFHAMRRSIAYLQQLSDGLHLLALDPEDEDATASVTSISDWWSQVGSLLVKSVPKRVRFEIDLPDDLPDVTVAPHRLTQAILNLVVNAGEAVASDGIVRIWARANDDRHVVRMAVTDNGEGMSAEVMSHAMDPFFTTKKRGLGTGLGLSLVHGVVQRAGGSVEIESEPGQGTTVTLNLPILRDETARYAQRDAAQTASITIPDLRAATFISSMLQACQFQVRMAVDGDPGPSRIWILEPGSSSVQNIKRYLGGDRRRRVVMFGPAPAEASSLGVAVIQDPRDIVAIRAVMSEVIQSSQGEIHEQADPHPVC